MGDLEAVTSLHANSLEAFLAGDLDMFQKREKLCIGALRALGTATDREIMIHLRFAEPNQVRPRITKLVEDGIFLECGRVRCPVTGKNVRRLRLRAERPQPQFEMSQILTSEVCGELREARG